MIKFVYIIISCAIVVSFTGCIQGVVKLVLKEDGSGTIQEKFMVKKFIVNLHKSYSELERSKSDSITEKAVNFYNDDEIIEHSKSFGDDVSYESHNFIINDKWEGYSAVYSFNDVSKVKLGLIPSKIGEIEVSEDLSGILKAYYYFKFIRGGTLELNVDCLNNEIVKFQNDQNEIVEKEEKNDQEEENALRLLRGMLKDAIIKLSIEVEGDIVNTNANYVIGSEVTLFLLDVNEMVKNEECSDEYFNKFLLRESNSIYNLIELFNKCPTMKLEVEKMLTINFK